MASEQAIVAFQELAPQIHVTNRSGSSGLVDPQEVADALKVYRQEMQLAFTLKQVKGNTYNFAAAAARAKQELKARLTNACQKDASRPRGPVT